jgi:hypothetical protein
MYDAVLSYNRLEGYKQVVAFFDNEDGANFWANGLRAVGYPDAKVSHA